MLTTWGRLSADRSLRVAAEFLEVQRPPGCVAEPVLARVPDENVTGSWKMLLLDDAFTLLRRATDLLPKDARAENGVTVDDVRDDQRHQEWELVLDLLMEIADEQPVSMRFWSLLEDAARQMMLEHSARLVRVAGLGDLSPLLHTDHPLCLPTPEPRSQNDQKS